jgi:hypothetical protein
MKRDAFAPLSLDDIKALANDAVPTLLAIVEERADAIDGTFMDVAKRLPDGWRQLVMAAHAIEGIEDSECLAGAFTDLRRPKHVRDVEQLLQAVGARKLAAAFAEARELTNVLVDEDMDPLDVDELRDVSADRLDLRTAREALARRALAMTAPFPPAR